MSMQLTAMQKNYEQDKAAQQLFSAIIDDNLKTAQSIIQEHGRNILFHDNGSSYTPIDIIHAESPNINEWLYEIDYIAYKKFYNLKKDCEKWKSLKQLFDTKKQDLTYCQNNVSKLHNSLIKEIKKNAPKIEDIELLLKTGTKELVNYLDESKSTPLAVSIRNMKLYVCKKIIEYGGDASIPNAIGITPLMIAAQYNPEYTKCILTSYTGSLDQQDDSGKTALFIAVQENNIPVVQLLHNAGAQHDITTKKNETAMSIASAEIQKILTSKQT